MIAIVVVSHSRALATAAVALAAEMVEESARPEIRVAAGLDETTFGTDATAIAAAIEEVAASDGVLVLLDLGSAILSAEMALEFVDPEVAATVTVSAAPMVEGLVAAVVTASTGASLAEVASEAVGALAPKMSQLGAETPEAAVAQPVTAELTTRWTIRNRHGLHARPAAALVSGLRGLDAQVTISNATTNSGPVSATSLTQVSTLGLRHGDVAEVGFSGPQASEAQRRFADLAEGDFGESEPTPADSPAPADHTVESTGTGQQVVVAPALVVDGEVDTSSYVSGDAAQEADRFTAAVAAVSAHLADLAAAGGQQAGIFAAQSAMLTDPDLLDLVMSDIAGGASAVTAVTNHFGPLADSLAALPDPYQAERAQDVRSLQRQLLTWLTQGRLETPEEHQPHILVVAELDAATAARLDQTVTLAVITTSGGATGHGVIVASSRGIPVLTGRDDLNAVPDHTLLGIDPATDEVWIDPDDATVSRLQALADKRRAEAEEAQAKANEPALTRSGVRIEVEANIASLSDAHVGAAAGADGSGLVRTEILFGDNPVAPTPAEQAALLVEIGEALAGPITVRTWDPGGDKPLAFLPVAEGANPMLGERGVRAMRHFEQVFADQLRAIVLAAQQVPVRVMFPMVTEPAEVEWARHVLADVQAETGGAGDLKVGIMIEVPAAAIRAAEFAHLCDFVSIGTNDLAQYSTASDRGNARVSYLASGANPAVLDLIGRTCASLPGIPVAVCGDLASDPELTGTLVNLGVTELSVRPPMIGLIKQAVRQVR